MYYLENFTGELIFIAVVPVLNGLSFDGVRRPLGDWLISMFIRMIWCLCMEFFTKRKQIWLSRKTLFVVYAMRQSVNVFLLNNWNIEYNSQQSIHTKRRHQLDCILQHCNIITTWTMYYLQVEQANIHNIYNFIYHCIPLITDRRYLE